MPDHVVTDEKGQVHRFPEEATPEMIAQALGVQPPSAMRVSVDPEGTEGQAYRSHIPPGDLRTGQGMDQQAIQQSREQIAAPVLKKAKNANRASTAMNRAMNSPMPFSNAVAAYAPVAAARGIAGAKVGSYAADKAGLGPWGSLIGGALGGAAASYTPGGMTKAAQRITRGPGGTGDVSVSPLTIAGRELENVVPRNSEFEPPPWQAPSHEEIPLGSPENPGPFNKVPSRVPTTMRGDPFNPSGPFNKIPPKLPNALRGDPFNPKQPPAQTPFTAPMEAQSAEGVPGSVPKPSGRLVLLPQEAQAQDQLQKIATTRASQHGMQYAAGMRPAGGGRVPMTPTGTTTTEYSGPRQEMPQGNPTPWATQGVNVTAPPPISVKTDSMGIRWASTPTGTPVSIPKGIPDEGIESYARPKLAEQEALKKTSLPWLGGT